jgi:hypothetical protein
VRVGEELTTDLAGLRSRLAELEPESVLCVFSTTSCFAPRAHDSLPEIAQICQEANIPHLGRYRTVTQVLWQNNKSDKYNETILPSFFCEGMSIQVGSSTLPVLKLYRVQPYKKIDLDTTLCFHFRLWYRHLHLLSALDPYRY